MRPGCLGGHERRDVSRGDRVAIGSPIQQAYPPLEGRDPPPPLHVCKQRFVCVTPCTGTVWDASRMQ